MRRRRPRLSSHALRATCRLFHPDVNTRSSAASRREKRLLALSVAAWRRRLAAARRVWKRTLRRERLPELRLHLRVRACDARGPGRRRHALDAGLVRAGGAAAAIARRALRRGAMGVGNGRKSRRARGGIRFRPAREHRSSSPSSANRLARSSAPRAVGVAAPADVGAQPARASPRSLAARRPRRRARVRRRRARRGFRRDAARSGDEPPVRPHPAPSGSRASRGEPSSGGARRRFVAASARHVRRTTPPAPIPSLVGTSSRTVPVPKSVPKARSETGSRARSLATRPAASGMQRRRRPASASGMLRSSPVPTNSPSPSAPSPAAPPAARVSLPGGGDFERRVAASAARARTRLRAAAGAVRPPKPGCSGRLARRTRRPRARPPAPGPFDSIASADEVRLARAAFAKNSRRDPAARAEARLRAAAAPRAPPPLHQNPPALGDSSRRASLPGAAAVRDRAEAHERMRSPRGSGIGGGDASVRVGFGCLVAARKFRGGARAPAPRARARAKASAPSRAGTSAAS